LSLRRVIPRRRCVYLQRRNANRLTCFKARLRLCSLAVHPHLAFADDALDVAERKTGKSRLKKTIDAHAGFIGHYDDRLYGSGKLRCLWLGARSWSRLFAIEEGLIVRAGLWGLFRAYVGAA